MNNKLITLIIVATIVLTSLIGFVSASIWDNSVSYYSFNNLNVSQNQTKLNDDRGINNGTFSGYSFNNGVLNGGSHLCYQESANVSNQAGTDGNCGLNYTGMYQSVLGSCFSAGTSVNFRDGNWGTHTGWDCMNSINGNANFTINYTKPINTIGAIWRFTSNIDVPQSCMNYSATTLSFLVYSWIHDSADNGHISYCRNSTGLVQLESSSVEELYEEGVYWNFNDTINLSSGKYGNAYSFDGNDDYINIINNVSNYTSITIAGWFKDLNTDGHVVGIGEGTVSARFYVRGADTSFFQINNASGTNYNVYSNSNLADGTWHYFVGVYNNSNIKLYIDGVLQTDVKTLTGKLYPTDEINIGGLNDIGSFNGSIDEVRIWNRALSQSEITQEMNSANPVNGNSLVSSYSFEQNNATTTFDTNHLVTGEILQGGNFDGVNDYIKTSALNGLDNSTGTYGFWFKANKFTTGSGISQGLFFENDTFMLRFIDNKMQVVIIQFYNTTTMCDQVMESPYDLVVGTWYYYLVTQNSSGFYLYKNGILIDSEACIGQIKYGRTHAQELSIGAQNFGGYNFFNGSIDEIGIWNRSLSAQEISALYYNQSRLLYENSQTFNPTTYETSSENFIINITYNSSYYSGISAIFSYNGTNYTGTSSGSGDNLIFSKTITIPVVSSSENKSFYWRISLIKTGTTYYNSITNEQEVNKVSIGKCGGSLDVLVLNFTATNETSLNRINLFNFAGTFNIYQSNSGLYSSVSIINTTGVNSMALCLSENGTYNVDADIDYSSSGFSSRSYYLRNAEISNGSVNNIQLYLLESATSIIINTKDQYLSNLKDHLVKVMRYYPGYGVYYLVETAKTDDFGNALAKLEEENVDYKFLISNSTGNQIYLSNPMRIICTATPCQLEFITGETEHIVQNLIDFANVEYDLSWNNNTGYVLFTFSDSSGLTQSMRLVVTKINAYGETNVCDNIMPGSAGILTCSIGTNATGEYSAKVYRTASPAKYFAQLSISLTNVWQVFGTEGLVWMFMFVVVMFFAGLTIGPAAATVLTLVSIVFMMATGIVYIPLVVVISIAIVVIIFIIKMRS